MKMQLKYGSLLALSIVLLTACSQRSGLKMEMEYVWMVNDPPFSSVIYVFEENGTVRVSKEIGKGQDICIRKDGSFVTSAEFWKLQNVGASKGTVLTSGGRSADENPLTVIFGPGDRMPVLQNAPYKIQGLSVLVDWSQCHSSYFPISHCNAGSEVFTIKNGGLVLESATTPGTVLTLGVRALTPLEEQNQELQKETQREAQRIAEKIKQLNGK